MLRLEPRLTEVWGLSFSPDNRFLIAVGLNRLVGGLLRFSRLALWDLHDPAAAPALGITTDFDPSAAYFLPDGRVLGVDSRGNWRAARPDGAGPALGVRSGLRGKFDPAAVSADGRHVALLGRTAFRCDPLTLGGVGWEDRHPAYEHPAAAAFSPDGRRVAVSWANPEPPDRRAAVGGGSVYDVETGAELTTHLEWGHRFRLAWSPDGGHLAAVARHGFTVYPAADLRHGIGWRAEGEPALTAAAYHPGGGAFVTADEAGRVHLWDAADLTDGDRDGRPGGSTGASARSGPWRSARTGASGRSPAAGARSWSGTRTTDPKWGDRDAAIVRCGPGMSGSRACG